MSHERTASTRRRGSRWRAAGFDRSALKNGLLLEQKLGVNPYKFGMVGSSDAHTGLAALEEANFFGKTAPQKPSPERMQETFFADPKTGVTVMDWEVSSSGYAVVWATENPREARFAAMARRETHATTGPRMVVRVFSGWDFEVKDGHDRLPAQIGYAERGCPWAVTWVTRRTASCRPSWWLR